MTALLPGAGDRTRLMACLMLFFSKNLVFGQVPFAIKLRAEAQEIKRPSGGLIIFAPLGSAGLEFAGRFLISLREGKKQELL